MEKTSQNSDYSDLLRAFNDEGVEYLVVGAHALAFYGYIRATGDLDIWVRPEPSNADRIHRALTRFGAPLNDTKPEEFASNDLIFQIGIAPVRIDVMTSISGISFDEAWMRRENSTYMDIPVSIIGLKDLIANKKTTGRTRDLADVEELQKVNSKEGAEPAG